ncbi:MAG: hypothetical protein ABSF10_17840 [Verrucomicrobiota bacterium]|jgi:hypothetical protein
MDELKYNGKTKAEWLAQKDTQGQGHYWGSESQEKVNQALLYFDEQEKKSLQETEERRFQTQLDEARRQGALTRRIALAALTVSVISVVLSECRKSASQGAASSQPVSQSQVLAQTNSTAVTGHLKTSHERSN